MKPAEAIKTGFRKTLSFRGRASRSEFWWFAPVAALPAVALGTYYITLVPGFWGFRRLGPLFLLSLPLLSAASRRLQDTGEEGRQAAYPFAPLVILWIGYQGLVGLAQILPFLSGLLFVLFILGMMIFVPVYFFAIWISLLTAASVLGMLLVPSQPGANTYGPNPHEVTT